MTKPHQPKQRTTPKRRIAFRNRHGYIKIGTPVVFDMENQDMWGGDNQGTLDFEDGKYVIRTKRSGTLQTQGYLSAYWNTIQPVSWAYNPSDYPPIKKIKKKV